MLTNAQRTTLLAAIKADATAGPIRAAGNVPGLLAWCNAAKAPAALAWSVAVQPRTSDEAATYTTYDSLVAGKRDSWALFLGFARDFSRNKVRAWIVDVWGNATASSIAEAILQAGTENATNAQSIIGGNSKTTGTVTALDRTFASLVEYGECEWFCQQQ